MARLEYSCAVNVVSDLASRLPISVSRSTARILVHYPYTMVANAGIRSMARKRTLMLAVGQVLTLLVMVLPFWMLKDLKISTAQKVGLAFIFSLAFACVALDIVRVVEAVSQHQALYTIIEINSVVIISCLPTYRALLGIRQRRRSRKPSGSYPWRSLEKSAGQRSENSDHHRLRDIDASEAGLHEESIHVTQEFKILNEERDPYPLDSPDTRERPNRIASPPRVHTRAFS